MKKIVLFFFLVFFITFVSAHGEEIAEEKNLILKIITISSIISGIFVLISLFYKKAKNNIKLILFLGIIIPVIIATVYTSYFTIKLNLESEEKGPVHWHADFEIWNCGEKIDLVNPEGMSNRVGNSVFHEHGDNRIHVEGVVTDKKDVDLHSFFEVVGGNIEKDHMKVPTNKGSLELDDNDKCNGKDAKLQAFLYKIINPDDKNFRFKQEKLDDFPEYVLSPYSNIPPGDCIIIEFDKHKEFTDKICETYKLAMQKGELSGS
ncbi:hypothetical protein HYX17_01375 [Candidatus Woesearchaeota archaeon]|nr:hypothetical protein [Candidatus Woesearchaeota archaeon]